MPRSSVCLEAALLVVLLLVVMLAAMALLDHALGVRYVLKAEAQGPTGHCATCNYQGSGWQVIGGTAGNSCGVPPMTWWNCPACHTTRITTAPNMVPGGVNPWTGLGATAWRGGGGYHLRPLEERWSRWTW